MKLLFAFSGILAIMFLCPIASLSGNTMLASLLFVGGVSCIGAGSMLDINTDIQVMERSLRANGLLPDQGMTMTRGGS